MNVVALLTGRGNSTLKDKNILPVLGKPLLWYPATAASRSRYITDLYASSDDDKILSLAGDSGYKPIRRPVELAGAGAQHGDVIKHAVKVMKEDFGSVADILVVLLANNASIKTAWIDDCIQMMMERSDISAVVPVYKDCDHHPYRAKRIDSNGDLACFVDCDQGTSSNRQDLEECYYLCHNFWVMNVALCAAGGQPPWSFLGPKVRPFVVEETVDVHADGDYERTEQWLKRHVGPSGRS